MRVRALCSKPPASTARRFAKLRVDALRDRLSSEDKTKAHWPSGLLAAAPLSLDMAQELIYEVGWNAQHRYVDVREEELSATSTARGALRVPLLPEVHTFETRLASALSSGRRQLDASDDDPRHARLILACDQSGEDSETALAILKQAGYANAVRLDGGFDRWRDQGFPVEESFEDLPDSTL
jgi:rhodanese-related sulfurtransferase